MEHSLHVASVAKTIARALCLNEDLVEAMAVGHDLGHAPFGHKGEKILREIAENNGSSFSHELHSLRLVDTLDSPYPNHPGLNLTFAVRDGIACHYGEGFEQTLTPDREKHPDSLKTMKRGEGRPATLEGCIVRWADKIAYLGRDLEDAVILGLVKKEDVPPVVQEKLGTTNRDIIANLVEDLVQHSSDDRLSVSGPIHEALTAFYSFSMENIYRTDKATKHYPQIERATHFLFDFLLEELGRTRGDPEEFLASSEYHLRVFGEFLRDDVRAQNAEHPQLVIDFIAGMTDSFFADAFKALFLPFSTV